jgi:hypothetical protein
MMMLCSKQIRLAVLSVLLTLVSIALLNDCHPLLDYQRHTQLIALLAAACN